MCKVIFVSRVTGFSSIIQEKVEEMRRKAEEGEVFTVNPMLPPADLKRKGDEVEEVLESDDLHQMQGSPKSNMIFFSPAFLR